ncbi:MAG: bifunctional (p)ppGpp synthetase/guanosine-3',5'-bis(diphosphate) 3'-pyrophosphohydrolase [Clostridia bacterium]|nr:bifunctional (p)ppGpp synthetase/guanosine-3',5'-bis(diphosphate) 3'-pyrophosphohydrolase [Clostridia bacterium]
MKDDTDKTLSEALDVPAIPADDSALEPIANLLDMLRRTGKKYDTDKIIRAFLYADALHAGQFRVSGEPYISHPVAVAEIVAGLELDTDSICAALLHDTVEDCSEKTNCSKIRQSFGEGVAMLVDGLTKLVQLKIEDKEEAEIENLRKMFLAMSKDIRVIFIKLCDRLHNMRTLYAKPENKRRITALETMHVYAPLAHRLGMQRIKQELEQLALSFLDPIGFEEVQRDIDRKFGMNQNFIENTKENVAAKLRDYNIKFTLEGRVKSVYSIYKKMYNQNKSFDEIYDFYAIRIIVDTELECYTVLGIIHEMYKSVPGRFKDYISTPKPNLYRSLHTTVIGRDGIPFEVQIRTWEMHHVAEYGICAHWKYKSGATSQSDIDQKLQWVAKLLDSDSDTRDPDEFMRTLKIDMFHDETFVFTPKGDVIVLPQGATLIDFAYAIHSEVGNKMVGAKINGAIATIDSIPKNGEIVEIITSSASRGPSRDWLKIVKTGEARGKIRQWFKREQRSENIVMGRADVERELKKYNRPFTDTQRDHIAAAVAARIGIKSEEDLYNTIGYGGLSVTKIAGKLKDEFERTVIAEEQQSVPQADELHVKTVEKPAHRHASGGIVIDGAAGCAVKFAKCCNPLPGDSVVGFITKGFGVSIHKADCPNVKAGMMRETDRDRWVSAYWEAGADSDKTTYEALIQIYAKDVIGLLAQISAAIADMRVSILQINSQKCSGDSMILNMNISCKNTDHVNSIVSRLKGITGVVDVVRGFS